ncbi:type 2 lantibiotic [Paenibacillus thiaminolyticus]|nr:type 2 lantibiotic [Paenibacillus thiaminolyticus]
MNQSCGNGLKSLTMEEMQNIYGASDVEPRATPTIVPAISAAVRTSSKVCLSLVASAIGGIASHNNDCLG